MRRANLLTAAALVACAATRLLAQTPAPAPVQTQTPAQQPNPTPTPTPTPPPTAMPANSTGPMPPATSAMPTPQPGTPPPSMADSDHGTSIVLLEHVQKVLDDAASGKSGQVSIDRSVIDELRAEVTQVKLSLQVEKP